MGWQCVSWPFRIVTRLQKSPANTSHEELWRFFNSPINSEPWAGPSSIFLISRSSCAFVNLTSEEDLARAVAWFNGKSLRPFDTRCPRLVCRVRRKDDDLRSGVGAQRGTGMHRDWIKKQQSEVPEPITETPTSPAVVEPPPPGEGRRRESVVDNNTHKSTESYASTNSSFLARHFPLRAFILKSATVEELEESVKTGQWRTQKHNEPVLGGSPYYRRRLTPDQAFRTSQDVVLIFGANKSGEFFGYAKMVEHIDKEKAKKWSGSKSSAKPKTSMIEEESENRARGGSEPIRPSYFLTPSQSHIAASSPSELTPAEEYDFSPDHRANTDPTEFRSDRPASPRAMTLDPKQVQPNYFPPAPIPAHSADNQADRQQELGGSSRPAHGGEDGVLRKDTALGQIERPEVADEAGVPFKIEWVKVGRLPFNNTRHLRNPWNADREVKVSRDGTEVEPSESFVVTGGIDRQTSLCSSWPCGHRRRLPVASSRTRIIIVHKHPTACPYILH